MSIRAVSAAAFVLVVSVPAFATDRKVPSQATPTIASAVAVAQPGDKILVGPGVWQENVVSSVANLQFIGKNAVWDGTLTNGTAGVALTASGGGIVVQGFTFRGGQSSTAQVQLTGDNCKVSKCQSRGPSARFLRITGNKAVVDSCTLFAVNSTALVIQGDEALVTKIKTRQCDDDVVQINGNKATVTKCTFVLNEDSYSVDVTGNDATVANNTFTDCDECISVTGDNALVEKNKMNNTSDIEVSGDNFTVRKNTMRGGIDDNDGIVLSSRTSAGGGFCEDNKITDVTQTAISVGCTKATIRRNKISGSGTESNESGVEVSGDTNTVVDNTVVNGGTHGFDVSGGNNTIERCSSSDSAADGFHVTGDDNKLKNCTAKLNTGEGLDNEGTNTTVTGCTFKDNRIDVANGGSFSNNATFANDNSFKTGGTSQAQQVN